MTFRKGTLTVNPAQITINIGNSTALICKTIDLAAELGMSVSTGVNGESFGITYTSQGVSAATGVGVSAINGTLSDGSGPNGGRLSNYAVTLNPGQLTRLDDTTCFLILAVDANASASPWVQVVNRVTGEQRSRFLAYESQFTGGMRVAKADLDGDGSEEIITAPGRGRAPQLRVFTIDGQERTEYRTLAYASDMINGVQLAAGDVNGDGQPDLVTAPSRGAAEIRVFLNRVSQHAAGQASTPIDTAPYRSFLAFPSTFLGGAVVAVADMGSVVEGTFRSTADGSTLDGRGEILVGSGSGMRATVNLFDVQPTVPTLVRQYLPFATTFRGGISSVVAGRVNADDAIPDLVISSGNLGNSQVETWNGRTSTKINSFQAFTDASRSSPVRVTVRDTDGDGILDQIWAAQGTDGKTRQIKQFNLSGQEVDALLDTDPDFLGEYFLA